MARDWHGQPTYVRLRWHFPALAGPGAGADYAGETLDERGSGRLKSSAGRHPFHAVDTGVSGR